jgi:FkbM family methyltransferase
MKNAKTSFYSLESAIFTKGGVPGRFLVSAMRSIANRRLQRFSIDSDGDFINIQAEGVIVSPAPHRTNYRLLRSRVVDRWFAGYAPKPGEVVLDIGAGIGEETVVFAEQVGAQGRVFSFEANPATARCLSKTVERSGLKNVRAIAAAVFDRPGKVSIANVEAHARNSLLAAGGTQMVEVPALTLDDFVEENRIQTVDLLKMNIEGAERPALLGFRRNFDRVRNVVIDCHDWIADLGRSEDYRTLGFVREFLESRGFIIKRGADEKQHYSEFTVYGSRRG